jgi:hypothetical protein
MLGHADVKTNLKKRDMKKKIVIVNFILASALVLLNMLLAFWALGVILDQWNLADQFGQYLTFPNFVAVLMLLSVNKARSFGREDLLRDRLKKLDGEETSIENTLKAQITSAIAILMMIGFSWIWSAILL